MEDLSLHILDIGENSIAAGASRIQVTINENTEENTLFLKIRDNGTGLDEDTKKKVLDPFYTTKGTKRVGLGLPMPAQAAREADILYRHFKNGKDFLFDTRDVKQELEEVPITDPGVLNYLKEAVNNGLKDLLK